MNRRSCTNCFSNTSDALCALLRAHRRSQLRRILADLLGESFDPAETAVAAFEHEDGTPKPPWLVEVYQRDVIGGPGAFVIPAQTRADFDRALRQKLIQEIALR